MSLEEYKKKRNFTSTAEPEGKQESTQKSIYVIQQHDASRLHWDLRLEIGVVLKSWALPKVPPTDPQTRRLAVETEDHPIDYADFEGTIPQGQYGAGKVTIWDRGTFKTIESEEDKLIIDINGQKLKGPYVLIRTRFAGSKKNWLFFKKKTEIIS
ncbi:MAG: DNA polymerase ligase N-terminal domain-containing protein [archaeon]